jgi:hypothetical protein
MSLLWVDAVHHHPTEESVQHIIDNYGFDDAYPVGASGPEAWADVKSRYVGGLPGEPLHPANRKMRNDIARNGIQKPIMINYHEDPPRVIDGHTRLWHAEALGMEKVPVEHNDWWTMHFPQDFPNGDPACQED